MGNIITGFKCLKLFYIWLDQNAQFEITEDPGPNPPADKLMRE